jgi:hypothetical protein
MLRFLWNASRGYRLRPWASPYIRWRLETYSGLHAEEITAAKFWQFFWREKAELWRFLRWAGRMETRTARRG